MAPRKRKEPILQYVNVPKRGRGRPKGKKTPAPFPHKPPHPLPNIQRPLPSPHRLRGINFPPMICGPECQFDHQHHRPADKDTRGTLPSHVFQPQVGAFSSRRTSSNPALSSNLVTPEIQARALRASQRGIHVTERRSPARQNTPQPRAQATEDTPPQQRTPARIRENVPQQRTRARQSTPQPSTQAQNRRGVRSPDKPALFVRRTQYDIMKEKERKENLKAQMKKKHPRGTRKISKKPRLRKLAEE